MVAFCTWPGSRILAQIDGDLKALATEVVQPGSLPEVLETFETASTLVIVADENGEIVARSRNLTMFNDLLDPNHIEEYHWSLYPTHL